MIVALALAPSANAQSPFEPNDSYNTASGPLTAGAAHTAALETQNDVDYYFFYLPQLTQLRYQVSAPAANKDEIELTIGQQLAESVDEKTYLETEPGQTATGAISLERGKYYLVVQEGCCTDQTGDRYTFRLDPPGVTSTYEPFAAECAAANPPVVAAAGKRDAAEQKLSKVKSKLATARAKDAKRERIEKLRARKRAAKVALKAAEAEYKAAVAAEAAACSVPQ